MVDKEKQVIAFIDSQKRKPFFEGVVVSRFGEVGEYYLQLIQTEARFQKLRDEIIKEQSKYHHFTEEELSVIAYIEAHKNMLYFEETVLESFGELGKHCLALIQTDPKLRHLRDEIAHEKKRFEYLQEQDRQRENSPQYLR